MLLGALSAGALPPLHVIPVLLLSVPGLLVLIGAQTRRRGAFAIGFWFGFGHHLFGLYWITEAILVEAARFWWFVPLAVPSLSAALALFIAAACAVAWFARPGLPRALTLAGAWVLADIVRQYLGTGFPWNPWGSVWAIPGVAGDTMLQPAAWIGTPGLTFATVLMASLPTVGVRAAIAGCVVLAVWAGFGTWRLAEPAPPPPGLDIVLLQGNVPQGEKWNRAIAMTTFEKYLRMTREGVGRTAGRKTVVVWPETASPFLLDADPAARAAIMEASGGQPVLAGSVRFGEDRRPRNSLMAITGTDPSGAIYDKWHLVPFGEYQPSWAPIPVQVVPGGGFAFGTGPRTFRIDNIPAYGPLICYEAIFPGQIADEKDRPAWLVNVTNDAWFGNSSGPRQHLAAARMRAVEEGLPLMRAANTGISAGFDAYGRELGRLAMNEAGILSLQLPGALPPTPFALYALWIPGSVSLAAIGLGILVRRRHRTHDTTINETASRL